MEAEIKQPANSIELARNAKGEYSYHIKCRGDDALEVKTRTAASQAWLDERYPVQAKAVKNGTDNDVGNS